MPTAPAIGSDGFRQSAVRVWASHALAEAVRAEVTSQLEAAGIPVLAVKGVVTSRMLYGDLIERPLSDVDLRIRSGDFRRVLALSRTHGWTIARVSWSYRNIVLRFAGAEVDIEGQIGPPGVCALSVGAMLRRAAVERRGDSAIRVPEIHDHAVILCVNVYKDKIGAAFPWALEDLARIARHDAFDADEFRRRVARAGIRTLAWIAADWFAQQRRDDVWAGVRAVLGPRPPRQVYAWLMRRLLQGRSNGLALRLLTRCCADDLPHRVRAMATVGLWALEHRVGVWRVRPG